MSHTAPDATQPGIIIKKIVYIGEEIVSQIAEENTGSDEAATQKPGWVVPLLLPLSCPIII